MFHRPTYFSAKSCTFFCECLGSCAEACCKSGCSCACCNPCLGGAAKNSVVDQMHAQLLKGLGFLDSRSFNFNEFSLKDQFERQSLKDKLKQTIKTDYIMAALSALGRSGCTVTMGDEAYLGAVLCDAVIQSLISVKCGQTFGQTYEFTRSHRPTPKNFMDSVVETLNIPADITAHLKTLVFTIGSMPYPLNTTDKGTQDAIGENLVKDISAALQVLDIKTLLTRDVVQVQALMSQEACQREASREAALSGKPPGAETMVMPQPGQPSSASSAAAVYGQPYYQANAPFYDGADYGMGATIPGKSPV